MKYIHHFQVRAPLSSVAAFHSRASSMAAITPPPICVRIHRAPAVLKEGDEMEFTLWAGPLPLRWLARIERVSEQGFTDRQLRGPFKTWAHEHLFVEVDGEHTQVRDTIELQVRKHWFWGPAGWGMVLGLPVLFAYRAYKTRKLLTRAVERNLTSGEAG